MNATHFRRVLDHITAHPETWSQTRWHCKTTHCFAGWAQLLSGHHADNNTVRRDARIYLDLSTHEADYVFSPTRTLDDLRAFLGNTAGYDRDGYDREGYDREGYDRTGYDRHGYDRDGYDRRGYDREGYDRDGLDRQNRPRRS